METHKLTWFQAEKLVTNRGENISFKLRYLKFLHFECKVFRKNIIKLTAIIFKHFVKKTFNLKLNFILILKLKTSLSLFVFVIYLQKLSPPYSRQVALN